MILFRTFVAFPQETAEEILRKIDISEAKYLDSLYLELYYEYKNEDQKIALTYAEKSLEFAERYDHYKNISIAKFAIGTLHMANFEYALAEINFNESLDIALKYNFDDRVLIGYSNLGILNSKNAKYDKAIDFYLKALKYAEKTNDYVTLAALYNNIGLIHYRLSDFEGALEYYLRCLEIKKENNITSGIFINYNNIGLCYNYLKDYNQALESFHYVIENCDDCSESLIIDSNYGLGRAYFELNRYEDALTYFDKSNKMSKEINYTQAIVNSDHYLAKIYSNINNYKKALNHLNNSTVLAMEFDLKPNLRDNYLLYSFIYEKVGNYKKALEYNNSYMELENSIKSAELIQNLKNSYLTFQKSQSDEIIAGKNSVIKRSNQFMIMLGIIMVLLIVVLVFAYRALTFRSRLNQKLDGMVQEKTKELIKSNAQLVKSRSELDSFLYRTSHDIRGPIATLLGLTSLAKLEAKDSLMSTYLEKINVTADKLNEIISRLTNVSQINSQPLDVQDTDIYHTINEVITELRHKDLEGVSFKLGGPPPSYIKTDKILLKIILENLLDNSFKFSDSNEKNSFVELDIQQNGNLELIVTDNGIGIESEFKDKIFDLFFVANEKERGTGIGLYQTYLATKKLHGKIELINNKKPTKFKLEFPDIIKEIENTERKEADTALHMRGVYQ
jgi:signal transduction histidine kinase